MKSLYMVKEAQTYLKDGGVAWTQEYIRRLIGNGKIKSKKILSSRAILLSELKRIINERREQNGFVQTSAGSR
jgi:hypothetical protein